MNLKNKIAHYLISKKGNASGIPEELQVRTFQLWQTTGQSEEQRKKDLGGVVLKGSSLQ